MSNTLFNKVDYTLASLLDQITNGQLGLPDIQRPFVWKNVKVRDLFDSMFRGYPVGYFLFWETGVGPGTRQIGTDRKQLVPTRVIVDGQQRLTSLYAVMKGIPVIRENFKAEKIEIAFNPLEDRFEVPDAALKRNKRFIPNISAIWDPQTDFFEFVRSYTAGLEGLGAGITREDITRAQKSLSRLQALQHFPFTALELTTQVKAEAVSDVFVRINSEGKKLNQSDFILTLMSVFWDDGRTQLEDFSRDARVPSDKPTSPFNRLFQPMPDQLLRTAIAVGFRRARLSAVYSVLRGRDPVKEVETTDRDKQFDVLKAGQAATLDIQCWHDFLKCVVLAGYRTDKIISGQNALVFAYSLYVIGRSQLKVPEHTLRQAIATWLFMSSLTGRFTSSPESQMEFDLARLRDVETPDQFVAVIENICSSVLTSDFWSITLPNELATSAARSPSMFAFFAALNVLDARVLYSRHTMRELMDPMTRAPRANLERHHLFPVAFLKSQGIDDQRVYNQIANFAYVEWGDNGSISDKAPGEYVPVLEQRVDAKTLTAMYRHHAIPAGWETMPYGDFLKVRRGLIADTIREAYEQLAGKKIAAAIPPSVKELIEVGENNVTEFKSTLRTNLHTGEKDPRMELAILKTIAGLLNSQGGALVVGVADDGSAVGIEKDGFPNEDKLTLHLVNLLKDRMGGQHAVNITPHFDDYEGVRVLIVEVTKSKTPVFVKDAAVERFYVRFGPSTQELTGATAQDYIAQRFR